MCLFKKKNFLKVAFEKLTMRQYNTQCNQSSSDLLYYIYSVLSRADDLYACKFQPCAFSFMFRVSVMVIMSCYHPCVRYSNIFVCITIFRMLNKLPATRRHHVRAVGENAGFGDMLILCWR